MSRNESVLWMAAGLMLALFLASSCGVPIGKSGKGFWDQHVSATAWGVSMMTMYGPINIGYIQWNRNVQPEPASPPVP